MISEQNSAIRCTVDGKFFRRGGKKLYLKGVTYGPFAPNEQNEYFPSREQTARDFAQIRELGANLLRLYYVPPQWVLDLAAQHDLLLLVDIPWPKHLCFLDSPKEQTEARQAVGHAVTACKGHPAIFAFSVGNEIPPDIVRWSGARTVNEFIEALVDEAKAIDPDCLCTYTSYPPTEFLRPQNIDFVCFNVYLHQRGPFENYLARLQMLADSKPLVLGEFGVDSFREGEERKCAMLTWQIEAAFRGGLAGTVIFSYTDDWFRGGLQIEDWAFGLTTRQREPKPSFQVVQNLFRQAPYFPLPRTPKVSVVVACYNGGRTVKACLDSLGSLNYPDYEVIFVDDGSTDNTPQIAQLYHQFRYLRQPNAGLSVARNTGIAAAAGEIIAFTDADCRADEDWLYYLASDLLRSDFAGIGGHNFLPPEDSSVAAAVLVSPGGPAHVMLTDRIAEHVPGCNMAFYKWALQEIGGFDPIFTKAGDDVDVCWRLREQGRPLGFSASGFVWHYRRSTVKAYLKQQRGYGEAEAMLHRKHPEYFNALGGGLWRGRIYSSAKYGVLLQRAIIYRGLFGSAFFQTLYAPQPAYALMLCTSLEYHLLVVLPLLLLTGSFSWLWPLALASILIPAGVCSLAAWQAQLPKKQRRFWSRPLVALLFFLQPLVRGWARYRWRLNLRSRHPKTSPRLTPVEAIREPPDKLSYWTEQGLERCAFLQAVVKHLENQEWQYKLDSGWGDYDLEIFGSRWGRLRLTTVAEDLGQRRRSFRCRLQSAWSLRTWILLGLLVGIELGAIALWAPAYPWLWMLLLSLPLLTLGFDHENRSMHHQIAGLIDEAAREKGLIKLDS